MDDGSYSACASPVTFTELAEGKHTFSARAMDDAGIEETTKANYAWAVSLPPVVKSPRHFINKGSAYFTYKKTVRVALAAFSEKGVAGYLISEDSTAPDEADDRWVKIARNPNQFFREAPFTLTEGKGTKTVHIWFKDTAGNVSETATDTIYLFNSNYMIFVLVLIQLAFLI